MNEPKNATVTAVPRETQSRIGLSNGQESEMTKMWSMAGPPESLSTRDPAVPGRDTVRRPNAYAIIASKRMIRVFESSSNGFAIVASCGGI